MTKTTDQIAQFLRDNTHPDLAARYGETMELQVNVTPEGGTKQPGGSLWKDEEGNAWWHFHFPRKDNKPNEYRRLFDLDKYVDRIALTGWDFGHKCSRFVGFDFDEITSHADGVGISDEELKRVNEAACALPWVEVRRSTGGKGLHLYVEFADPPATADHHEHAALARSVLALMSRMVGFSFDSRVDVCGQNMWIMARKAAQNEGLSLIKAAEHPLQDVPDDWRDHLDVVTGKRTKVRIRGVSGNEALELEQMAASCPPVPLDEGHHRFINAFSDLGFTAIWQQDHHLLSTHTCGVKEVFDKLNLKGIFETDSAGTNPGEPNCFLFPLSDSRWRVCRYGKGTAEAKLWETSPNGWTTCVINEPATLELVGRQFDGMEDPDGGLVFTVKNAERALGALGESVELPEWLGDRQVTIKDHKKGIVAEFPYSKETDKGKTLPGWLHKNKVWVKLIKLETPRASSQKQLLDSTRIGNRWNPWKNIRHVVRGDKEAGWYLQINNGTWVGETKGNVASVLIGEGFEYFVNEIFGHHIQQPWTLVSIPFAEEYPGRRQWNRDAAQLIYVPSDEEGPHEHWDMILRHVGEGLNDPIAANEWCKKNGITDGYDYLLHWIASMIRRPGLRLPYLFFYSPQQNTGKSSFHEALRLLMRSGAVEADKALKNQGDFNGELNGKVLCVVEETDVSNSKGVYERLKNWVTADEMGIQFKGKDTVMMPNYTHWVQTANSRDNCPVQDGDQRVVMTEVMPLLPNEEIPKHQLLDRLKHEAPHFMRAVMDVQFVEPPFGRLYLPVLQTEEKKEAMQGVDNKRPLTDKEAQLVADILGLKTTDGTFEGTASKLAEALGSPWTRNSVGRLIRKIVEHLEEKGISVTVPERCAATRGDFLIAGLTKLARECEADDNGVPCDLYDLIAEAAQQVVERVDEEWLNELYSQLDDRQALIGGHPMVVDDKSEELYRQLDDRTAQIGSQPS